MFKNSRRVHTLLLFFKQYLTQLDEVLNTIWGGSFDAQLTVI